MGLEPKYSTPKNIQAGKFASPLARSPLALLRDTEGLLRRQTVETLVPMLPRKLSRRIQAASVLAEDSLNQIAEIDSDEIDDSELRSARILISTLALLVLGAGDRFVAALP